MKLKWAPLNFSKRAQGERLKLASAKGALSQCSYWFVFGWETFTFSIVSLTFQYYFECFSLDLYQSKAKNIFGKECWKEGHSFAWERERILCFKRWAQTGAHSFFGRWERTLARSRSPFRRARWYFVPMNLKNYKENNKYIGTISITLHIFFQLWCPQWRSRERSTLER